MHWGSKVLQECLWMGRQSVLMTTAISGVIRCQGTEGRWWWWYVCVCVCRPLPPAMEMCTHGMSRLSMASRVDKVTHGITRPTSKRESERMCNTEEEEEKHSHQAEGNIQGQERWGSPPPVHGGLSITPRAWKLASPLRRALSTTSNS